MLNMASRVSAPPVPAQVVAPYRVVEERAETMLGGRVDEGHRHPEPGWELPSSDEPDEGRMWGSHDRRSVVSSVGWFAGGMRGRGGSPSETRSIRIRGF